MPTFTGVDLGVRLPEDLGLGLGAQERLVEFDIEGDGFLRHMVRALAGTPRGEAWPNAPPQGLMLMAAQYPGRVMPRCRDAGMSEALSHPRHFRHSNEALRRRRCCALNANLRHSRHRSIAALPRAGSRMFPGPWRSMNC
jgi:hypothetical protein